MTDANIDTQVDEEEEEEGGSPAIQVMIPIGLTLALLGLLVLLFAVLSGLNVGPFPALLARLSGLVGFYPSDTMYGVGVLGACLLLGGMVTAFQGLQAADEANEADEEAGETDETEAGE